MADQEEKILATDVLLRPAHSDALKRLQDIRRYSPHLPTVEFEGKRILQAEKDLLLTNRLVQCN